MKILVTGGSGFIGSHLVRELVHRGDDVSVFDINAPLPFRKVGGASYVRGDIRDSAAVSSALRNKDVVFHLATTVGTHETIENAVKTSEVGILGTLNVLNAVREVSARMLFVSKPNIWLNPYSISKQAAEDYCLMYHKEFGTEISVIRWFSVYGPGQSVHRLQKAVPTFIHRALQNRPLPVYGDGTQSADFIYITDAIEGAIRAVENEGVRGIPIDIGSGVGTPINRLAEMIIKLSGSTSSIEHVPMRRGEDVGSCVIADTHNMKTLLKFNPAWDLEKGLRETIEFYRHCDTVD